MLSFPPQGPLQDIGGPPTSGFMSSSSSHAYSSTTEGGSVWGEQMGIAPPIRHHWFYLRPQENYWIPFSMVDSNMLEGAVANYQDTSQQVCNQSELFDH